MKKVLYFILTLTLSSLLLLSCAKGKGGENDSSNKNDNSSSDNNVNLPEGDYIFAPGGKINIVTASSSDNTNKISEAIWSVAGIPVEIVADSAEEADHEIIVGKCDRKISVEAYRLLNRVRDESAGEVGYLIYSNGNSVAIAYDVDEYNLNHAEDRAVDYFVDTVIGSNSVLRVQKGTVSSLGFNLLEYQESIDDEEKEAKWQALERNLAAKYENGAEIAKAFKYYVDMTGSESVVTWLADLYDLERGGFYFSNSGRNTEGFLPDIESTAQAVGFFISSGMFKNNKDYPEWFADKLVYFVKSLQDPNGYISHPQWDRETLEKNTSRMSRDLGSAYQIFERFGASPTYPLPGYEDRLTPDGILADGTPVNPVAPASSMTWRVGTSKAAAVSKVVAATDYIGALAQLKDKASMIAYLDDFAARNKLSPDNNNYRSFYQIANTLTSQSQQILQRDRELAAENADYKMSTLVIDWMNEHQNKTTGLWDPGLTYANTDAFYKAINLYNNLSAPIPNPELAIESIIQILINGEEVDRILCMFNVWGCLNHILENITDIWEDTALAERARNKLISLAPEAIRATTNHQLTMQKPDGSFSYFPEKTTHVSQSMPVAVPNTNEGDVNCTTLTIGGILSAMAKSLGVTGIPGPYTKADGIRCIDRIKNLGEIVKDDLTVKVDYFTFDDDSVGNSPVQGITSDNLTLGHMFVVEAPTKADSANRAVEFSTKLTAYESLNIPSVGITPASTCYAFEADFCVTEPTATKQELQVLMQDSIHMITISVEGDDVWLEESSSRKPDFAVINELDAKAKVGEWFTVKVEFYPGDKDTVRAKIYFNNKLIAVTDNFFDDSGAKLSGDGQPKGFSLQYVNIIAVTTCEMTILIDNLAAYGSGQHYTVEKNVPINVDAPAEDRVLHDFESGEINENLFIIANDSSVSVEKNPVTDSSALKLVGAGADLTSYIASLPIVRRASGSGVKTAVFESDIYVGNSVGDIFRIAFKENNSKKNTLVSFDIKVESTDGGKFVRVLPVTDGKVGLAIDGIAIPVSDEFKLRIEYYEEEFASLIFVNDSIAAMTTAVYKNAPKYNTGILEISGAANSASTVYLDNLIFEKDKLSFADSAAPEGESEVHDFSSADSLVSLGGGAVIEGEAVKLSVPLSEMKINATENGVVHLAANFGMDIKLSENSNDSFRFALYSANDTPIIVFDLSIENGVAYIKEVYAGGNGTTISRISVSDEFKLSFTYYYKERLMAIAINDTRVAINTLGYSYDNEGQMMSYLKVTKLSGSGYTIFDNVITENTLSFYISSAISGAVLDPKNDLSFELTHSSSLPGNVIYVPRSNGTTIGVKGLTTGYDSNNRAIYSKFLAVYTAAGGNDTVDIDMPDSDKKTGAKVTVFESEIMIDYEDGKYGTFTEMYLCTANGTKAWYASFATTSSGSITISDYSSGSASVSKSLATEKKIFKLRLEYTLSENGELRVHIFIDGEYVATSTKLFKLEAPISPAEVTMMRFYTTNAASGYLMLDNAKIYHTDILSENGFVEPEPEPDEPENPPIDPDPDDPNPDTPDPDVPEQGGNTGPSTGEVRPSPNPDVGFDDVVGTEPTDPDQGSTSDGSGWT